MNGELVLHSAMNFSSILWLLVSVVAGYVAHPLILPYVEDKLPEFMLAKSEKSVGEPQKEVLEMDPSPVMESAVVVEQPEPEPKTEVVEQVKTTPEVAKTVKWDPMEFMKKVISEGDVSSIAYEDVQSWELAKNEKINGEEYEVGYLEVTPTTIFGRKPQRVKVLMLNKAVVKWVLVSTGEELH